MNNIEEILKIAEAYKQMQKEKTKKLDPVGKADADIDNDGDTDSSDEYLHNRRKAIKKSMKDESSCSTMKKESVDIDDIWELFSDEELEKLEKSGLFEKSGSYNDKHIKGATKPEEIDDKDSPKSREFAKKHDKSDDNYEDMVTVSHKDSIKAGSAAVKRSPARTGDNLTNGDTKPKTVTGA